MKYMKVDTVVNEDGTTSTIRRWVTEAEALELTPEQLQARREFRREKRALRKRARQRAADWEARAMYLFYDPATGLNHGPRVLYPYAWPIEGQRNAASENADQCSSPHSRSDVGG